MPGNYKQVSIKSSGDDSGVTFTITGTNYWNNAQTDTVTGGNNSVVTSTKYFKTVSKIEASGATDGVVTSGSKASQSWKKLKTQMENYGQVYLKRDMRRQILISLIVLMDKIVI